MCDFISWIERADGTILFLTDADVWESKRGAELRAYCGASRDYVGHGAIERFCEMERGKSGTHRKCADFSSPANFPPEIVAALKAGRLARLGRPVEILRAGARAEYTKVRDTAEAKYREELAAACAEHDKACAAAWAERDKVCDAADAQYREVLDAEEYNKVLDAAGAKCMQLRDAAGAKFAGAHNAAWEKCNEAQGAAYRDLVRVAANRVRAWK